MSIHMNTMMSPTMQNETRRFNISIPHMEYPHPATLPMRSVRKNLDPHWSRLDEIILLLLLLVKSWETNILLSSLVKLKISLKEYRFSQARMTKNRNVPIIPYTLLYAKIQLPHIWRGSCHYRKGHWDAIRLRVYWYRRGWRIRMSAVWRWSL